MSGGEIGRALGARNGREQDSRNGAKDVSVR